MKNITPYFALPLVALALVTGCNNADKEASKDAVAVVGKVEHPQADKYIYLDKVTSDQIKRVDSAKTDGDGNFKFNVRVEEPTFYSINFYEMQQGILVLTPENKGSVVELQVNGQNNEGKFTVSGSKDSEYLVEFAEQERKVSKTADSLRSVPGMTQEKFNEQYGAILQQREDKNKKLLARMDNSIVAIAVANTLDPGKDIALMDEVVNKLKKAHPNLEYVKKYEQDVTRIKQSINAAANTAVGKPAPDIALPTPAGKTVSLSSLKGKYVLIDFWASWCRPCRMENPNVVKLYNKYKGKNFEIFGVSLDDSKEKWMDAIRQDGLTWTHVSDLKQWQSSVVPLYSVDAIPMTVLVDRNGIIIAKNLRGEALEQKLAELQ